MNPDQKEAVFYVTLNEAGQWVAVVEFDRPVDPARFGKAVVAVNKLLPHGEGESGLQFSVVDPKSVVLTVPGNTQAPATVLRKARAFVVEVGFRYRVVAPPLNAS